MHEPTFLGVPRGVWPLAIPIGAVLAGLGCAAVAFFAKPVYEARFRMELTDPNQNFIELKNTQSQLKDFLEVQKTTLLGTPVLEKALTREAIATMPRIVNAQNPIHELRKRIGIAANSESGVFDVTFQDEDPKVAAAAVNAVADEFFAEWNHVKEVRASKRQRSLMAALIKAETEVEAANQRVRDLSMQTVKSDAVVGETPSGRIDTSYLDELRRKRMELQSRLAVQTRRLAQA
ncbi:MAG: hypothetical protein ACK5OB_10390 [Pirellula sp.]